MIKLNDEVFGGKYEKYLCLFILLILTSCTTLSPAVNSISQVEASEISAEIGKLLKV